MGVCPGLPPWHSFHPLPSTALASPWPAVESGNDFEVSKREADLYPTRRTLFSPDSAPSLVVLQGTPLMGGYRLSFSPSSLSHSNAEACHAPVPVRRRTAAPRSSHVARALTWDRNHDPTVLRFHTPIAHSALARAP